MRNRALAVAFLKDSKARVMFLDGNGDVPFGDVGAAPSGM